MERRNKCAILVLVLVIAAAMLFYWLKSRATTVPENEEGERFKKLDQEEIDDLHRFLVAFDYACERAGITYWASCGTMLGIERHSGFIPWDYDIDTQVDGNDFREKREELKQILESVGYTLTHTTGEAGLMGRVVRKGGDFHKSPRHVDVFTYDAKSNRPVDAPEGKLKYPCMAVGVENIYPVRRARFGSLMVNQIAQPGRALDSMYGGDWRTTGVGDGFKIDLTKEKFAPLKPSNGFLDKENPALKQHAADKMNAIGPLEKIGAYFGIV